MLKQVLPYFGYDYEDFIIISIEIMHHLFVFDGKKHSETRNLQLLFLYLITFFCNFLNINSIFTYVTCEIFLFNLFLLMEMKHYKNKIITCTILITLLLSAQDKINIFFSSLLNQLMSSLDSFIQLCELHLVKKYLIFLYLSH